MIYAVTLTAMHIRLYRLMSLVCQALVHGTCTWHVVYDSKPYDRSLDDAYMRINELLAEEGRRLNMINGGRGTLSQCLSKEIYGDEDTELEIR